MKKIILSITLLLFIGMVCKSQTVITTPYDFQKWIRVKDSAILTNEPNSSDSSKKLATTGWIKRQHFGGGGGGSQNLSSVLTVGDSAYNKRLKLQSTTSGQFSIITGDSISVRGSSGSKVYMDNNAGTGTLWLYNTPSTFTMLTQAGIESLSSIVPYYHSNIYWPVNKIDTVAVLGDINSAVASIHTHWDSISGGITYGANVFVKDNFGNDYFKVDRNSNLYGIGDLTAYSGYGTSLLLNDNEANKSVELGTNSFEDGVTIKGSASGARYVKMHMNGDDDKIVVSGTFTDKHILLQSNGEDNQIYLNGGDTPRVVIKTGGGGSNRLLINAFTNVTQLDCNSGDDGITIDGATHNVYLKAATNNLLELKDDKIAIGPHDTLWSSVTAGGTFATKFTKLNIATSSDIKYAVDYPSNTFRLIYEEPTATNVYFILPNPPEAKGRIYNISRKDDSPGGVYITVDNDNNLLEDDLLNETSTFLLNSGSAIQYQSDGTVWRTISSY